MKKPMVLLMATMFGLGLFNIGYATQEEVYDSHAHSHEEVSVYNQTNYDVSIENASNSYPNMTTISAKSRGDYTCISVSDDTCALKAQYRHSAADYGPRSMTFTLSNLGHRYICISPGLHTDSKPYLYTCTRWSY